MLREGKTLVNSAQDDINVTFVRYERCPEPLDAVSIADA